MLDPPKGWVRQPLLPIKNKDNISSVGLSQFVVSVIEAKVFDEFVNFPIRPTLGLDFPE
jgi:hypothetical protein